MASASISTRMSGEIRRRTSTIDVQIGASHAALGQALGIRLINLSLPGTPDAPGIEVDFDDVRLTATAVPGPASGVLVAVSALAALVLRRSRHPQRRTVSP